MIDTVVGDAPDAAVTQPVALELVQRVEDLESSGATDHHRAQLTPAPRLAVPELIHAASDSTALNPADLSANQPNYELDEPAGLQDFNVFAGPLYRSVVDAASLYTREVDSSSPAVTAFALRRTNGAFKSRRQRNREIRAPQRRAGVRHRSGRHGSPARRGRGPANDVV